MSLIPPTGPPLGDPDEWLDGNAQMAFDETTVARPDIDSDIRVIVESIFDRLAERMPGWIARDGDLTTILVEEFSTVAGEIRGEAMVVPEAIFQTYAEEVLGIPRQQATSALGVSSWHATNDAGWRIPVGTKFTLARSGDDLVAFETAEEAEIAPGQTLVSDVPIRAMEPGTAGNDLYGLGDPIDPLAWVDRIEVDVPTSGAVDAQSLEDFLTQVIWLMRLVAIRPILPWDFAALALRIPGVARAVAMDGYNPGAGTWGHARTITLIVTDQDGEPCTGITMQAVRDYLEALREVNWIVHVIAPQYPEAPAFPNDGIDVTYTVTAFTEQNPEIVERECTQAIYDALLPSQFRLGTMGPGVTGGEVISPPPPYGDGGGPNRQTIRVNNLTALLSAQRGVDFVNHDGVEIMGQHDDYRLPSPLMLPRPGTITGTVLTQ